MVGVCKGVKISMNAFSTINEFQTQPPFPNPWDDMLMQKVVLGRTVAWGNEHQ